VIIGRSSEYFDFFVFGIACVLVFPPAVSLSVQARWHAGGVCHFLAGLCGPPCRHGAVHGRAAPLGRATKLTLALLLLGVCTVGMTFLPSYEVAGMKAVWALVILRVGQGLALGGTWDGLPSLLAMSAPKNRRGWYSMIGQLGAPLGFIIAAALFAYLYSSLTADEFMSWGWRFPFCVAFAINVVALFARLRLVGQSYTQALQERELEPISVTV
jgi:MFS family permease